MEEEAERILIGKPDKGYLGLHPENLIPGVQSLVHSIIGILYIHKGKFPETLYLLVPAIVVGTPDRIPVKT